MKWEYRVLNLDAHPTDLFAAISRAGKEGWELVGPMKDYVYVKRPVQPQEEPRP